MASLESKLLDGGQAGYCSSSEGEEDAGGWKVAKDEDDHQQKVMKKFGNRNTGAKGVLSDFADFREEVKFAREMKEKALRREAERGMLQTSKEEREQLQKQDAEEDEDALESLRARRLDEMRKALTGLVVELAHKDQYIDASETKNAGLVLILLHEPGVESCIRFTHYFKILASDFPHIKFLRGRASLLGLSEGFQAKGVPCLQVWEKSVLVGNFLKIDSELPDDYNQTHIMQFLFRKQISLTRNAFGDSIYDDDAELSD
ncbi:unnamed protein product, partial [Mesorhabditis spiculigera]